jgi:hypothetical protein
MTECSLCQPGSFSAQPSKLCDLCDPGFFTNMPGMSQCRSCEQGKVQLQAGEATCLYCSSGTEWINSTFCATCPASTYSTPITGACVPCAPGTYSDAGAEKCTVCEAGTYSASGGPIDQCETCSKGWWSNDGSSSCSEVTCPENGAKDEQDNCICKSGFEGSIFWDPLSGVYVGYCTPCHYGFASAAGQKCERVDCPLFSSGHPHCTCNSGFYGEVIWSAAAKMYISGCSAANCPMNSFRRSDTKCECLEGYEGLLELTDDGYSGTCSQCTNGRFRGGNDTFCTTVACPANSNNHPNCICENNYIGEIMWVNQQGYVGECHQCGLGKWAKAGATSCSIFPCPAYATGYPDCTCTAGYNGTIEWADNKWNGQCTKCPVGTWSAAGEKECTAISPCPVNSERICDGRGNFLSSSPPFFFLLLFFHHLLPN